MRTPMSTGQRRGATPEEQEAAMARFAAEASVPFVRAIIRARIHRIADSCGYGVPLYAFQEERRQLPAWAERKGADGLRAYQRDENRTSIDGLPGLRGDGL